MYNDQSIMPESRFCDVFQFIGTKDFGDVAMLLSILSVPSFDLLGPEVNTITTRSQDYKSRHPVHRSDSITSRKQHQPQQKTHHILIAQLHKPTITNRTMSDTSATCNASTSTPARQHILIVGCGIAGPVLATFLLSSPGPVATLPHITILERNTAALGSGQNIDIRGIGKHVVEKLGLTQEIKRATTGEEGVKIVDATNRIWAQFAADKTGKVETGTSDVEILRGRLAEILLEQVKRASKDVQARGGIGVEFIFGDRIEELDQDETKVYARFAKAGNKSYDLVVGADGLHSKTRKLAWGAEQEGCLRPLGMYGAFFSTTKEKIDGEWRSWYHAPGGVSVMLRPSGTKEKSTVLVLLADKDGSIASEMAGSERDVLAQKKSVLKKLNNIVWQEQRLQRAVEAADDFYFDTTAQIKLDRWSKGRVVLLGDAGWVLSSVDDRIYAYIAKDTAHLLFLAWVRHWRWLVHTTSLALLSLFPVNIGRHLHTMRNLCDHWLTKLRSCLPVCRI